MLFFIVLSIFYFRHLCLVLISCDRGKLFSIDSIFFYLITLSLPLSLSLSLSLSPTARKVFI